MDLLGYPDVQKTHNEEYCFFFVLNIWIKLNQYRQFCKLVFKYILDYNVCIVGRVKV